MAFYVHAGVHPLLNFWNFALPYRVDQISSPLVRIFPTGGDISLAPRRSKTQRGDVRANVSLESASGSANVANGRGAERHYHVQGSVNTELGAHVCPGFRQKPDLSSASFNSFGMSVWPPPE